MLSNIVELTFNQSGNRNIKKNGPLSSKTAWPRKRCHKDFATVRAITPPVDGWM